MKLFALHAPLGLESVAAAEAARAEPTGFSVAAFVFGPLWLLARGLWLALAVYAVLAAATLALAFSGWLAFGAAAALFGLGNIFLGVQGRGLAIHARERRGLPLAEVIFARSALEAEKIYIERKLRPLAPRRGFASPGASGEVIGLFPESGR